MVVGHFHGGNYIAQGLCPDNIHLLASRQTGINFLVASLLLPQLFKCLDFPGNANVGNLRTWPGIVFFPCCPCCLLGKNSSEQLREKKTQPSSSWLLFSFPVNADNFHRKLSNRNTKSCSSAAIGMSWVQPCHGSIECCNECSPFAGLSHGDSTLTTSISRQIFGHSKDHQGKRKKTPK